MPIPPTRRASRAAVPSAARTEARARAEIDPDRVARPFFVLRETYLPGVVGPHIHACGQLIHAAEGVLQVDAQDGRWVVPPQRGVWIPPGLQHSVQSARRYELCTLYVSASAARHWPRACAVVRCSALVNELLLAGAALGFGWPRGGPGERLLRVLLEQLDLQQSEPMHLPAPRDKRAARVADALRAEPSDRRLLSAWAATVGASERTLARLFVAETGLNFVQWRRQCRLLHAVPMLVAGEPVTQVALAVGYEDASAFARDVKRMLGRRPTDFAAADWQRTAGSGRASRTR